jgi:outer membrane protein, heavy metal efflux system
MKHLRMNKRPELSALIWFFSMALGPAQSQALQTEGSEALTIEQAVAEAIQKNLDLIAERYNLPIADARIVTAKLRPNPVLSLWGNYLDILGTGFNAATNAAGPSESGARVDFVLERGGKRQERIAVAEDSKAVSQLQLLNSTRTLILDVQSAFVDVLQAKADLALARENLGAFEETTGVNVSDQRRP